MAVMYSLFFLDWTAPSDTNLNFNKQLKTSVRNVTVSPGSGTSPTGGEGGVELDVWHFVMSKYILKCVNTFN